MNTTDRDEYDDRVIRVVGISTTFFEEDLFAVDDDDCIGRNGTEIIELVYDRTAPYAVSLLVYERDHEDFTPCRIFARDLLIEGIHRATGDGTVSISPDRQIGWIAITLNPHRADKWSIYCRRDDVEAFLQDTFTQVPIGAENISADWDAELGALLGGA